MEVEVPGPLGSVRADLVGRAEELTAVKSAMLAGGCVIAGAAGVGKSRLAEEAAASAGGTVLRALATASAATVPFGAFGHLVDAVPGRLGRRSRSSSRRCASNGGSGRPTVVVDDAHLLDGASAALVLALATTDVAALVVTIRSGAPLPDAVTALWKARGLELIELQPLGHRDVCRLVARLLEGPVHAAAYERINDLSRGNPLYVRELVHDARSTAALHQTGGLWCWREELLAFDRLRVLVERRTREASAEALQALELVAVGAPIPYPVLCELASPAAVEELERLGLVTVRGAGPAAELRPAHPLYAEVVAERLPPTTAARLRRTLAAALDRHPGREPGDRLRIAQWLLEAGDCDPALFVEASRLAVASGAPDLGVRLARAAGEGVDAALATSCALNGLARFDEVEPILAPHEPIAAHADEAASTAYLETRFRALLYGSEPEATPGALLHRAAGWHSSREWAAAIATHRGWVELYAERPAAALELVDPLLSGPALPPLRRFALLVVAVHSRARIGLTDTALHSAAEARGMIAEIGSPPWEDRLASILLESGTSIEDGRELAAVEARLEGDREHAAAIEDRLLRTSSTIGLGMLALRRGHIDVAIAALEVAVDAPDGADPVNNVLSALIALATAHAQGGDAAAAERVLARVDAQRHAQPRLARRLAPELEYARALTEAAAGRVSAAVGVARLRRRRARAPARRGRVPVRDAAARRRSEDRRRAARRARGACAEHRRRPLRRSRPGGRRRRRGRAARRRGALAELGLDLHAADAACAAAVAYRNDGRASSARHAVALAARYAVACKGAAIRALAQAPAGSRLTTREREIAGLAARGMTNRAIAAELVLSVRTVESCILRACRKLGVDSRQDLAQLLNVAGVWLAAALQ